MTYELASDMYYGLGVVTTNPLSPHSPNHLCWLLKCHKLQQLPLELQQAYWPELLELEYPAEMEQERPVISDNDYRSQIMEEAKVEAILLGKAKEPTLPQIQTLEMEVEAEEAEEGEILEMPEEGEIPQIQMQQEQHPQIPIPIESAIN